MSEEQAIVFDIDAFGEMEVGGGAFVSIPTGKYERQVDAAEVTMSKASGNPMIVLTSVVTEVFSADFTEEELEEGKTEEDLIGATTTDYFPLQYTAKKGPKAGQKLIHWNIPGLFNAADPKIYPKELAARKKAWAKIGDGPAVLQYVADKIVGKSFVSENKRTFEEGIDKESGLPMIKSDDDGNPILDEDGNEQPVVFSRNNWSDYVWPKAKTSSASKITV